MCVIIHKPKGIKLKEETYRECMKCHSDGAGIAYVKDKKLIVEKGFFKFDELYPRILEHEEGEMIIHFRRISAGNISKENCHPFLVEPSENFPNYSFAVAHNGTLPYFSTKTESDTFMFMKEILEPHFRRDPFLLDYLSGNHMLSRTVELRNKLVIMRYDSDKDEIKTYIIHESQGYKDFGCWFSNASYRIIAPYVAPYAHGHEFGGMHEGLELMEHGASIAEHMKYEQAQSDQEWFRRGYYKDKEGRYQKVGELLKNKEVIAKIGGTFPACHKGNNFGGIAPSVIANEPNANIKSIVVPRDGGKGEQLLDRLSHLTKKEKKMFRRLALDYAKATLDTYEGFENHELIAYLRGEYKHKCFDGAVKEIDIIQLDKAILKDYLGPHAWFLDRKKEGDVIKQIQQEQLQADY